LKADAIARGDGYRFGCIDFQQSIQWINQL
jgi:hypothetical protein